MKPVVSVGSTPAHASVSATAVLAKPLPVIAGKTAAANPGPLSDTAGKSISVTQRGTKGEVSLALAGHGSGVNLGVSFGRFTISPR